MSPHLLGAYSRPTLCWLGTETRQVPSSAEEPLASEIHTQTLQVWGPSLSTASTSMPFVSAPLWPPKAGSWPKEWAVSHLTQPLLAPLPSMPPNAGCMAQEAELDLVKIAPTAKPPVCKIIDYGKYRYELARKEKEAKKKQKVIEVKEVRLSPNIDTNDLNTKMGAARKFLEKGDKVKVTLRFRGREMAHMSKSKYILDDFAENLKDIAVIDKPSKVEGRSMVMFLTAKK